VNTPDFIHVDKLAVSLFCTNPSPDFLHIRQLILQRISAFLPAPKPGKHLRATGKCLRNAAPEKNLQRVMHKFHSVFHSPEIPINKGFFRFPSKIFQAPKRGFRHLRKIGFNLHNFLFLHIPALFTD